MSGQRGFTLVESLVALVVFLFGVGLAAQLLLETGLQLRDGYARDLETPLPSVRARLRADLEAAASGRCQRDESGAAMGVLAVGHPAGTIVYHLEDTTLWRYLGATPEARSRILEGVTGLSCAEAGELIGLEWSGRRRALRRTPLVGAPTTLPGTTEPWRETLWVAPRGAGREGGW